MRILMTGGAGHIGTFLVPRLLKNLQIQELVIIDSVTNGIFTTLMSQKRPSKTSIILKDIQEISRHEIDRIKDFDCIIHLAAETNPARTTGTLEDFRNLNLKPTKQIISLASSLGIPLIFPSTTSVYDKSGLELLETTSIGRPTTPYAQCKLEEEAELKAFFAAGGAGSILRLGTIHGYSRGMKFHTAVNKMVIQAAARQSVTVWQTALHQVRPYLSLEDLYRALEIIMCNNLYGGETYNLATAHYTVAQILEIIQSCLEVNLQCHLVDSPSMNDISFTVSTSKIKNLGLELIGSLQKDVVEIFSRLAVLNGN